MNSYDYQNRKGIRKISWDEFQELCQKFTKQVSEIDFDLIIGVAKDGLFPIRLSRKENDEVKFDKPTWRVDIPDISSTGESLELVKERAKEKGALEIKTLVLIAHKIDKYQPDYYGLDSDELIILHWHKQILVNGKWQLHPELQEYFNSLSKD